MKTITQRFNAFSSSNIGAIPTLSKAVRGMNYGMQIINDAFRKFVPKDEYVGNEKDRILNWLYKQTREEKKSELDTKLAL